MFHTLLWTAWEIYWTDCWLQEGASPRYSFQLSWQTAGPRSTKLLCLAITAHWTKFSQLCSICIFSSFFIIKWKIVIHLNYSIVKDSNADLGAIFFLIFGKILIFLRENKEASFLIFWIFKWRTLNRTSKIGSGKNMKNDASLFSLRNIKILPKMQIFLTF